MGPRLPRRRDRHAGTPKELIESHEASAIVRPFAGPGVGDPSRRPNIRRTSRAKARCPAVSAGPAKVAVIAFQAAVSQTNEFQRDFADLQKKYDPKRQQLKTLSDEIDTLTKQLQDQGAAAE